MQIDYAKLDPLCVPMVKLFNAIGLPTFSSCQGHSKKVLGSSDYIIIFTEDVTDEMMENFINRVEIGLSKVSDRKGNSIVSLHGWFSKHVKVFNIKMRSEFIKRNGEKLLKPNWYYQISGNLVNLNQASAHEDFEILKQIFADELQGQDLEWPKNRLFI